MDPVITSPAPAPAPVPPAPPPVVEPPVWTPATKKVAALLTFALLLLLGYHAWGLGRWGTRPSALLQGNAPDARLDLNRAELVELMQLPGVGETLAERIVAYREDHGRFTSVDDLRRVRGVGPAVLEQIRPHVTIDRTEAVELTPTVNIRSDIKKEEKPRGTIDLNRATAAELEQLDGVGRVLAGRIIEARERRPFETVDDLRKVPGVGPKTLERVRPHVHVKPTD